MPQNIILVHGYSVRSLETYNILPKLLIDDGYLAQNIYLSAYDSLNDDITCDDLARALEVRITELEAKGLDLANTGMITHSSGASITRRWILDRWAKKKNLPSHFISLAGVNHGSTLAQMGATQIAYLYRELIGGTQVGAEVLQDLDYGSSFLLRLNEEWLDAYNETTPLNLYSFSLIGADHSALEYQLFWQMHENGSDSTVRISADNLNYRMYAINQNDINPKLVGKQMPFQVPHLVLNQISHYGENGILGGNAEAMKIVYPRIKEALQIKNKNEYSSLAKNWQADTDLWSSNYPTQCNSTLAFSLHHPGGRNVEDSLILFKDKKIFNNSAQALSSVNEAIEARQPIQNNTLLSSFSFYVNYPLFNRTYPHTVEIHINSGSEEIQYPVASYTALSSEDFAIRPNEFLYIKVTLDRKTQNTYELIPFTQNPDMSAQWPPLPQPKQL